MSARPAALLAAGFLALAGAWVGSPSASAAVTDGHCTTDTGVTLVVDYQELGGGRVIKCVEDVPEGTSGLRLLRLAGMTSEGTIHDGPGFVCRINGRPGLNESIPVDGSPDYRERCVDTPPKTAFWSYWHAPNGGRWSFSQLGAGNREVIIGGYEGWSFSLNNTENSNPAPGVAPSHPVVTPEPTPSAPAAPPTPSAAAPAPSTSAAAKPSASAPTTPRTTTAAPAASSALSSRTTSAAPSASAKARATRATAKPSRSPSPSSSPTPSSAPESALPSPSPSASPSPSTAQAASPTPTPGQATGESSAPDGAPAVTATIADDGGVPIGTIGGAGAVGALGLGGAIMWWRRRGL